MNNSMTIQNRIWLPLVAAGIALALAVGLLTYVLLQQQTESRGGGARPAPTIEAPTSLPQARWRVKTVPKGGKRISKAEQARVKKRGAKVATVVQTFFDTLFLDPTNTDEIVAATFTRGAAKALARPGVGLPQGAEEVQTLRRRANIILYAETASQAIATVEVRLKGVAEEQAFRLQHAATLWLQRSDKGWRVMAYEITQKPR
jgi:hypothetical protein